MKAAIMSTLIQTVLGYVVAKTTPKRVAVVLAIGVAVTLVTLAKNMTQLSYALAGSNYAVTPQGQIWVWPNNDRGKGGSAVYAGTYWDSYYHRGSSMHPGWSSAMMAIGRASRPGLTDGANTGGYQGYIGGSKLNWNTGNPGGPVGSDPFTGYGIPSSGAQLWPD